LVFTDRGGEKGDFSYPLAREARDPDWLAVPRAQTAVGGHLPLFLPFMFVASGGTRVPNPKQADAGRANN